VSRNNWHLLFSLKLLIIFSSCHTRQDESILTEPVFRSLAPAETGINFANHIKENQRNNFLTYPYMYNGGGVAIGDLDNDGFQDIYFTGNMEGDRLFHNQGNLKFTDVTRPAGILKQNLWTTGVTMADVNNDGLLDIYVCRSGERGFRNNLLYINQGDMRFEELAREWGVNDNGYSTQATFFDYDLDGDLDMYLVNHSNRFNFNQEEIFKNKFSPLPEEADQLYRNEGNRFINLSKEAGTQHFAFGLSATAADLNKDGYPDIYAGSDFFEPDFMYVNQQDGTFQDVLQQSTRHISFSSMGADIADINNDGLPDIFVADMRAADHYRFQANMVGMNRHKFARMLTEGYHYQYMQNTLQLHMGFDKQGLPVFSEIGQLAGVSSTDWSWSALFFDMDNDGLKDLFVSNGIARDIQNKDAWTRINESRQTKPSLKAMLEFFPEASLKNYTFQNSDNLDFRDVSSTFGLDFQGATNGASYADLDNDGDLELVMNNLNAPASVYENTSAGRKNQHFLQIKFRGREDNYFGLGAKVNIYYEGQQQYHELTLSRGFQSSVPPLLHFGTDSVSVVDKVEVIWPNGKHQILENVATDQLLVIDQRYADKIGEKPDSTEVTPLLQQVKLVDFVHMEDPYDDFAREAFLPFKLSSHGPTIAIADVNADPLEDFFLGGSAGYPAELYLQNPDGTFTKKQQPAWQADRDREDTNALFFDADQDGDQDLFVTSGSTEFDKNSAALQDRFYINDGTGEFTSVNLPSIYSNNSCVAGSDFDQDGDTDLFVGGGAIPGSYPRSEDSYLLINESGRFRQQKVGNQGVVSDAVWFDIDQDKDEDLLLVGHWMAPQIFENIGGNLQTPKELELTNTEKNTGLSGWWHNILATDLDQDGKIDLVLGNEGLNVRYPATSQQPLEMLVADYDENGSLDALMSYHQNGHAYPIQGRDKILSSIPTWQRKFSDYHSFATMTMEQILSEEKSDSILYQKIDQSASCILFNEGEGKFSFKLLPKEAQISAINALVATDLNMDNRTDLILAGNHHDWEVETSRNDAGIGLVLLSVGKREFRPLTLSESGLLTRSEVSDMKILNHSNDAQLLLIGQNQDSLQLYKLPEVIQKLARIKSQ
jgi:enediyne biosynthesis protein E4